MSAGSGETCFRKAHSRTASRKVVLISILTAATPSQCEFIDAQKAWRWQRLAREEGIFVGTSSGLNVVGALQLARELGPGHTVAVDTGLKYLAGDLYEDEHSL
jgi:cysteine synthase